MAPSFFLLVPPQRAPEQHVSDASHRRRWPPPRLGRKSGSAPRCATAPPPRVRDGEAFAGAPSRARCNPKIALPPCAVRLTHPRRLLAPPAPARSPPRAQVYPIWAAIGGAVTLCTFFCTRQMTTSPGFRCAHPDALPFAPRDARRDIFSSIAAPGAPPRRRAEEARSRARASRLRARAAAVGNARVLAATNAFAPPRVRAPVPDRPLNASLPSPFPPPPTASEQRVEGRPRGGRARGQGAHQGGRAVEEHAVRKMMRNVRPQIFPGLNDAFGK